MVVTCQLFKSKTGAGINISVDVVVPRRRRSTRHAEPWTVSKIRRQRSVMRGSRPLQRASSTGQDPRPSEREPQDRPLKVRAGHRTRHPIRGLYANYTVLSRHNRDTEGFIYRSPSRHLLRSLISCSNCDVSIRNSNTAE